MKNVLWITKSGSKIKIGDMTDQHIINTIRMLHRAAEVYKNTIPFPMFNGEMAQMYAEQEYDKLMDTSVEEIADSQCRQYKHLIKELERRKLSYE